LNDNLTILDNYLEGKSFLVGNGLTIADVVVAGTLSVHY
jgi:glutathione S-transferase